jgi:hypothetical protein
MVANEYPIMYYNKLATNNQPTNQNSLHISSLKLLLFVATALQNIKKKNSW